jgi:hypothetical protein
MGLASLMLFTATLLVVRNQRILHAWDARHEENSAAPPRACPRKPANGAARPHQRGRPRSAWLRHPNFGGLNDGDRM